jgi:adenine-specific DNA-methyltransferase
MNKQDFIQAGFSVIEAENNKENKLLSFLKENYPSIIKDNEIDLTDLKAIAGLPVDEKVNGYGLNFVGRNFARAKYAQKTTKELRLNTALSKDIDTTQNLVLKGDNLDTLKILKNHYRGKIKCIYIDPPYNTAGDEFVYPDKFDKEEAEVLGLANLSDEDFARMDFSFKTKKSHNGWLSFMYPRLLLARELLSNDGVIFISIDDNEQANLKLLCDEIFGEENFVGQITRKQSSGSKNDTGSNKIITSADYILTYTKNNFQFYPFLVNNRKKFYRKDDISHYSLRVLEKQGGGDTLVERPRMGYSIYYNKSTNDVKLLFDYDLKKTPVYEDINEELINQNYECYRPQPRGVGDMALGIWRWGDATFMEKFNNNEVQFENGRIYAKERSKDFIEKYPDSILLDYINTQGTNDLKKIINDKVFDFPKPVDLIKFLLQISTKNNDIILDFFAGSGTTGHAVMELNKEDGGNRKFILCQIDEPINKNKPAYKFCKENNLPPVISSITIERLRRAGEKIAKETEETNSKNGMFEEDKKQVPDIGFKVFDSKEAPKLEVDENGQISISFNNSDVLSRIYNMIFTVGLDEPTQVPEEVIKDCIYKIGKNYYITNSEKISKEAMQDILKDTQTNGKIFIDAWTASINTTLQQYKEDVKIVF